MRYVSRNDKSRYGFRTGEWSGRRRTKRRVNLDRVTATRTSRHRHHHRVERIKLLEDDDDDDDDDDEDARGLPKSFTILSGSSDSCLQQRQALPLASKDVNELRVHSESPQAEICPKQQAKPKPKPQSPQNAMTSDPVLNSPTGSHKYIHPSTHTSIHTQYKFTHTQQWRLSCSC